MLGRALDRFVSLFSPQRGLERVAARASLDRILALGGGKGGYDAGKLNRLTKYRTGSPIKENAIPADEVARLRWQAWQLYRNNPYARKIVRAIQSQTVGKGLHPASTARRPDGAPHLEFRTKAAELWRSLARGFDFRGVPGRGGLSLVQMQRLVVASVVLSGEILLQLRPISWREMTRRGLPIPWTVQLIDADRLDLLSLTDDPVTGNQIYRGIEIDGDGRRVAYHLRTDPIGSLPVAQETVRISAEKIGHLYVEEDIDQYRGVTWFAPNLLQMRDTGDYQYNELKASALAACVVLGYRRPTGASRFGLRQTCDGDDDDENGNAVSSLQPGMLIDLGSNGDLQGFNPARPGANAEAFIQHMLRGAAAGMPGIKSSTVTGDYRNSSFSSERSADNDAWPELEAVQEFVAFSGWQPIYEAVIEAAVVSGWFDGIVTAAEFAANRANFLGADWQGPVSRSINPKDDALAAALRIKAGQSSPQLEAAAVGRDWQALQRDIAAFFAAARALDLPDAYVNNILSIDVNDQVAGEPDSPPPDGGPAKPKPAAKAARGRRHFVPPDLGDGSDDEEDGDEPMDRAGAPEGATADA